MTPELARALSELGRVAARQAGIPDDVVITMTLLPDREYQWCDLEDDYAQESEDIDEPKPTVDAMDMDDLDKADEFFYAQTVA